MPLISDDGCLDSAEVVIVGGGVIGAGIACQLARAGVSDVLLLEAGELGSGSSGKPLGGVRAQFSSPANVRLGARSLLAYRDFEAQYGVSIGLQQVGYLFLLRSQDDVAAFESSVRMQNELGVPSRLISADEAGRLNPYLDLSEVIAAVYSPDDGFAHPGSVVLGYSSEAVRLGARVRTQCRVTGIDLDGSQITAVRTTRGPVATGTVICAAGAWSAGIGAMAGVDLPVVPLRRQIAFTSALTPRPPRIPFTIDFGSTLYFHQADDGAALLLGIADPDQPAGFETVYDESWLPLLRTAMARCAPSLADVRLERGWAGLYEMTPDCDALIGQSPVVSRFLYAAGYSGHGFLQAPATGEIIRDLYLGREPFCDVSGFDALRFVDRPGRTELTII